MDKFIIFRVSSLPQPVKSSLMPASPYSTLRSLNSLLFEKSAMAQAFLYPPVITHIADFAFHI